MFPNIISPEERDFSVELVSTWNGNFCIHKRKNSLIRKYYIDYPSIVGDRTFIGPYYTLRGAEKYAWSLRVIDKFEEFE